MTMAELLPLFHGRNTIRLADGKVGLVITMGRDDTIGVQVDGEDDIRWTPVETIQQIGGYAGAVDFIQPRTQEALQKHGMIMNCTLEFWQTCEANVRRRHFISEFDAYLLDWGMYRAGPATVDDDYEQVSQAIRNGMTTRSPHVRVKITADSASMLRPRNKSSKTKTPSLERERLDSIG